MASNIKIVEDNINLNKNNIKELKIEFILKGLDCANKLNKN
ncbi:hypothetical protein [Clostridium sp. 19966]|nr:hypothetical protein [Clostridium sp. 19966]